MVYCAKTMMEFKKVILRSSKGSSRSFQIPEVLLFVLCLAVNISLVDRTYRSLCPTTASSAVCYLKLPIKY